MCNSGVQWLVLYCVWQSSSRWCMRPRICIMMSVGWRSRNEVSSSGSTLFSLHQRCFLMPKDRKVCSNFYSCPGLQLFIEPKWRHFSELNICLKTLCSIVVLFLVDSWRWKADCQFGQGCCFGADERSAVTACIHHCVTNEPPASCFLSAVSADVYEPSDWEAGVSDRDWPACHTHWSHAACWPW